MDLVEEIWDLESPCPFASVLKSLDFVAGGGTSHLNMKSISQFLSPRRSQNIYLPMVPRYYPILCLLGIGMLEPLTTTTYGSLVGSLSNKVV